MDRAVSAWYQAAEMTRFHMLLFLDVLGACSSGSSQTAAGDRNSDGAAGKIAVDEAGGGGDSGTAAAMDSGAVPDAVSTPDTWANYAQSFFTTYCTSCHNAQDTTGRDYNIEAKVAKDKDPIRCGVAASQDPAWNCGPSPTPKQFPIGTGPKPSDAERARIIAWINAGEP